MRSKQLLIVGNIILIPLLIWNPYSVQATISDLDHFFPITSGDIWEREFHLDTTDGLWVYFQIGVFAKYNITISLNSIDSAPYSILCSIKTPPNNSINDRPEICTGRLEKFSLSDGERCSYLATSYIHLGLAYIYLRFDENYTIPTDGISGKITIHVIDLGLQDNSLYRTEFRLDSNQSSFEFEFEPQILFADEAISYGKETELRMVVYSAANSTGDVRLNISDSFMDIYKSNYPQKYTTFQPMTVSPGTTHEQIFSRIMMNTIPLFMCRFLSR